MEQKFDIKAHTSELDEVDFHPNSKLVSDHLFIKTLKLNTNPNNFILFYKFKLSGIIIVMLTFSI